MYIIGFSGVEGAGKTTAADLCAGILAKSEIVAVKMPFAGTLRTVLWGWFSGMLKDKKYLWGSKVEKETPLVWWEVSEKAREVYSISPEVKHWSGRLLMMKFATEGVRSIYGGAWVDLWKKEAAVALVEGKVVLVDDVRFPNEAVEIAELGGKVLEIDRGLKRNGDHPSMVGLPRSCVYKDIPNKGTLGDLEVAMSEVLRELL